MITLYSTHCPKCKVLEKKLALKGVSFNVVDDTDQVLKFADEHGFKSAPLLDVNGLVLSFEKAVAWINEKGGE